MFIEATKDAVKEVKKILKKQETSDKVIRVNIEGFGWGGPSLGLVLDEHKNDDYTQEIEGIKFVAGEELNRYKGFNIEYVNSFIRKGFVVTPKGMPASTC